MNIQRLSFFTIDLMKSAIKKETLLGDKSTELILQIGKEIDRCKVNNEPTDELEYLYETVLWLKSEIINEQSKSLQPEYA